MDLPSFIKALWDWTPLAAIAGVVGGVVGLMIAYSKLPRGCSFGGGQWDEIKVLCGPTLMQRGTIDFSTPLITGLLVGAAIGTVTAAIIVLYRFEAPGSPQ